MNVFDKAKIIISLYEDNQLTQAEVSKRLNIADENDNVETVEKKLCQLFDSNYWHRLHHLFIFFGRYKCKSRNPECNDCPFTNMCNYYQKTFSAK